MPRPRRATTCRLHHITVRGNNRRSMFDDADDRENFYAILGRAMRRSPVECHLDVLMGNHFHLFLEGAIEDVSALMWDVNYRYALAYNGRYERINHLIGRRFHATPIADRRGARAVAVYIALNPVRHGFCDRPHDWPYGAFRAYAELDAPREHLSMELLAHVFGEDWSLRQACEAMLATGMSGRPSLAALLPPRNALTRHHVDQAIRIFGYTHEEIAAHYGVSSRTLNRWIAM